MPANDRWWLPSAIVATVTVALIFIVAWFPDRWATWVLLVWLGVFVVVYFLNPGYRYWRLGTLVVSGWLGSRAVPTLAIFGAIWREGTLGFLLSNDVGPAFDVSAVILAVCLFVLDANSRAPSPPGQWLKTRLGLTIIAPRQSAEGQAQQSQLGDILGDNASITITQGVSGEQLTSLIEAVNEKRPVHVERVHDFNAEIDAARDYIKQGQPDVAIAFLGKLRERHWDRMSAREKFRVEANMGHAYASKEGLAQAAAFFFKAKAHQPADEHACALEACGLFFLGKNDEAYSCALKVLADFPQSSMATAIRIRSASNNIDLTELEGTVPEPLRADTEVLFALGWAALKRDDLDQAERYARRGLSTDDDAFTFKEQLGAILVKRATVQVANRRAPDAKTLEIVDEAIGLLTGVLAHHRASGSAGVARVRYNRAVAFAICGKHADAETDFRAARELEPHDPDIAKQYAIFLLRRNDTDAIIEVLRPTFLEKPRVDNSNLFARLLDRRNKPGDRAEALALLEKVRMDAMQCETSERLDYLDIRCALLGNAGRHVDAMQLLESVPAGIVSGAAMSALKANSFELAGQPEAAQKAARQAANELKADSADHDRFYIAQTLTGLKLSAEALAIWRTIVDPASNDPIQRVVLECARLCGDDKFIVEYCEALRNNGVVSPYSIELEVATLEKYNELPKAIEVMRQYLANSHDEMLAKTFRVRLSLIGMRLGTTEIVERDAKNLPAVESVTPHLGRAVVQILADGPNPIEAVNYAYELVRRNFSSPDAHMALVGAVGIGDDARVKFPQPTCVEIGCAVQCKEDPSGEERWFIIEDSPNPDTNRQEIGSASTLASELLSKQVGDKVYLRRDVIQDRTATVELITTKYEYRASDSFKSWEDRFPDDFFVRKYDFGSTPEGEPDAPAFIKGLERHSAQREVVHDVYRQHPLSMTNFAQFTHVTVIESLSRLASRDDLPIRCCRGDDREFGAVADIVRQRLTLVMDPSALATLFFTDVFRQLNSMPMKCVVSVGTIDEIRRGLLEGHRPSWARRLREGAERDSVATEFLAWIDAKVTVAGGLALAEIEPVKRDRLVALFGQPTAESIALAVKEGMAIWTDDFAVAEVAASELRVRRAWSQSLFEQWVIAGSLSGEALRDCSLRLIEAGYVFTRMTPEMGIEAAKQAKWNPAQNPLLAVVKWFRTSAVKPEGALGLMAAIVVGVWREAPIVNQKEDVTRAIVEGVGEREDGLELLSTFGDYAPQFFGIDVLSAENCARIVKRVLESRRAGRRIVLPGDLD